MKKVIIAVIIILLLMICVIHKLDDNQAEQKESGHKQGTSIETPLPEATACPVASTEITVSSTASPTQSGCCSSIFSRAFGKWVVTSVTGYGYIFSDLEPETDYIGGTIEVCDNFIMCDLPNDEYDYVIKNPKFVMQWQSANDFFMERYAPYKGFQFEDDEKVPLVEIKSKEGGFGTRFWIKDKNHIVIDGPQYFLAKRADED
ncbi:MAG: hypothetical protein LUH14_07570 [Clostridiaceae bacterium]|nr:hypothetical protein [Clostridiaceae bacterium]